MPLIKLYANIGAVALLGVSYLLSASYLHFGGISVMSTALI